MGTVQWLGWEHYFGQVQGISWGWGGGGGGGILGACPPKIVY